MKYYLRNRSIDHAVTGLARYCSVLFIVGCLCMLAAMPAHAWKPYTHIYAANLAIEQITAGSDTVNIHGTNYALDPRVAGAIRKYPTYYRGGVVGPDGYPDIFVGQSRIHPDTRGENGTQTPNMGDGHSFTYEWLRHVFEAGWAYYNSKVLLGDDASLAEGQKVLAFTYGYLTHAAGDLWAHTFVNDFARGIFPSPTEFSLLPIGIRHIVVEGYLGKYTPVTDAQFDAPLDFVYTTLIAGGKEGGFVDSANQDTASLGRGAIFDFFFDLRHGLEERSEALKGLGPLNPLYYASLPVILYMDAWIEDIDDGLQAWPGLSHQIAVSLFTEKTPNSDAALDAVGDFLVDHFISMLGVPDILISAVDIIMDLFGVLDPLMEPLIAQAEELRNYLIKQATGIDIVELKKYLLTPENHINSPLIGLDPGTSLVLDGLMGRPAGGDTFNPTAFAAMNNTILTSKLLLLSAEGLNKFLYDHRVGPLYSDTSLYSDRANFMLGFVRTIDGHNQWRRGTIRNFVNSPLNSPLSEGMPIWVDCLSRDRVFRQLFTDWQNTGFPNLGEASEDISATPPPTSSLAVTGPTVAVGGTVFVGGGTTFAINGAPDHFWNANEITVSGSIMPGGSLQTKPSSMTLGPIVGPDGVYTVSYNANGLCIEGAPHGETPKTSSFTLDQTPPVITITSPTEGQSLDVINTVVADFAALDAGSGLDTISAKLDGTPIEDGAVIDAFLLMGGDHHLIVEAADKLGNKGTLDRTFGVHATIAGLKAAIERAYTERLITIAPKDLGTQQLLDAAQASLDRGNPDTTKKQLAAAAGKISAQIGRGVDAAFADRFISWVNDLITRL